jgi:iron complex outermembrane receptor protein
MQKAWLIALRVLGVAVCTFVHAQQPSLSPVQLNIDSQPLVTALNAWATQTGYQVLTYVGPEASRITSPVVRGVYTPEAALRLLLARTDLKYRFVNARTVAVGNSIDSSTSPEIVSKQVPAADQGRERPLVLAQSRPREAQAVATGDTEGGGPDVNEKNRSANEGVLEQVVVTGTHIRGSDPLSPLLVLTNESLRNQGYTRLDQALEQLPQNFKGGVSEESNGLSAIGENAALNYSFASGVNLRGLGTNATLVLLNGRRLPPTAFGSSVDISQIPLSIIDRVEILTDGASALYGADAVAGVVNLITRKNFSGVETGARVSGMAKGKAPNSGANVLAGFDWDGGNLVTNFDYEKDSPLFGRNRSFAAEAADPFSLLPENHVYSAYTSLNQRLADRIALSAGAIYSNRRYSSADAFPASDFSSPFTIDNRGDTSQIGADLQLDFALTESWRASVLGQYARESDNNKNHYSPEPQDARQDFEYTTPSVELRIDGPVASWSSGEPKLAAGVASRHETLDYRLHDVTPGSDQTITSTGKRDVRSAYAELYVPLVGENQHVRFVKRLSLDVAGRYDHYSDFGGTTNPKVALRWVPIDDISLHASYAKSFRAPTLYLVNPSAPSFGYVFDIPDPESPTGTRRTLLIDNVGNPELKPETARSINAGLVYKPRFWRDITIELSYFDIDFKNKIEDLLDQGFFINAITDAAELGSFVNLRPSVSDVDTALNWPFRTIINVNADPFTADQIRAIANVGHVNAASSHPKGVDLNISVQHAIEGGRTYLDASGSYFASYQQRVLPASSAFESFNRVGNPLRIRAKLTTGAEYRGWNFYVRGNYATDYANQYDQTCGNIGADSCPIASYFTVDAGASISTAAGESAFSGIRIGFDVVNVFNRDPPFVRISTGRNYDPTNASSLLRAFGLTITKSWSGQQH